MFFITPEVADSLSSVERFHLFFVQRLLALLAETNEPLPILQGLAAAVTAINTVVGAFPWTRHVSRRFQSAPGRGFAQASSDNRTPQRGLVSLV